MKKRIVSMILALSMMLSILPVSAFADAGAGFSSAVAEETNSITYGSVGEHEDVGRNSETNNQVVKIKTGANGLPKAASGTGWSYDETAGLTITGVKNRTTEYVLDGTVSCNVTVKNVTDAVVYLLDGTVTGTLLIDADNMYGVYVLDGSYAEAVLNNGTIDGGTYNKLTEKDGCVRGGYFRDISGLSDSTQQQAHKLLLPENCTLNGRKETGDIYIVKKYDYSGTGKKLELVVESDTPCEGWAVATTSSNGGVMTLPAGVTDYNFTYNGNVIAKISISADGRTLSASFSMIPMSDEAPMKLVTIPSMSKELSFTDEGLPDLTGVTCVESLDEGEYKLQAYLCRNWTYACYPNIPNSRGILTMADQGGREIDFKELSHAPINCAVQLTNATITDAAFGEKGALVLTSGKITGGTYPEARVGISTTDGTGKVEITGGVFDSLSCYGECTISNAVILDCMFSTFFDNSKFAVSDTVFGALPDDLEGALAAGQKISKLVVRNGNVTAINGRNLTLSTNTIYLVGAGTADITLDTDVLSINEEAVENYNANTSAAGKVLRITGNNDGADILVNKSTDVGAVKPLRITEDGLPDLTGVEPKKVTGEGMEITLYEGQGWKYAIMSGEDEHHEQRTASQILITSPDGNPVDLTSSEINPSQAALKSDGITLQDVTVTSMYADAPVELNNAVIESGYFQKEVTLDATSTIAGGVFDATVKLRDKAKITAGVFHDIKLPNDASKAVVIENAVILGSLTGNNSEAAVSDTVSLSRIDSAYLAAGQQQSELRSMDGVMTDVNGNSVADVAAVYRIGDAGMVLTFTKPVTNINGKPVSAYNGAQLSPDGKTLYLNGRNDGADIVVNQTGETTEKLPFSSLTKEDFVIDWSTLVPGITCKKEGVGKPSVVFVRTYDKKEFNYFPHPDVYGIYEVYIRAEEGTLYEGGELQIDEGIRPYKPTSADFNFDLKNGTATYKGQKYFGDAVPQATLKYSATNDWLTATETVPTEAGTYYVWLVVEYDDYYNGGSEQLSDRYTVVEKLPFSSLKESNFKIEGTAENPIITCDQEGVGELSLVSVRTDNNAELDHIPSQTEYGSYKIYIEATEGERYTAGRVLVAEEPVVRKYRPTIGNFSFDLDAGTATYTGPKYYGNAVPKATLKYSATNDLSTATETVPTEAGTYYVWLAVEYDDYYYGSNDQLPDGYTVAEKLPFEGFEGFTLKDFNPNDNGDGTFTLTSPEGVGKLTAKFECITGVNKDVTYTNEIPDANKFGRYRGTIIAEEGTKYKAGSIVVGEDSIRYTPEVTDFAYDATKNTVEYKGENYYDADPKMTLLYGTDKNETVPTAPGSYDVYVKMTAGKNYIENAYADDEYIIYQVGTYVVPEPTKPKYYWNGQEGMEQNVGDKITLSAYKQEGYNVIWKIEGLAEDAYTITDTGTHIELQFFMPSNDVRVTNHYEPIYYTLTVDGKEEHRAFGKEVTLTAPEKEGHTFTGWEVDGVPEGTDTTGETIHFTMPANKVTLTPQYKKNTYTLTVDGKAEPRTFGEEVTFTAPEKEGHTFTGWKVTGLSADVDTTSETINFTMPANNVTLTPQYKKNTYTLTVNGKPEQRTYGEEVTLIARKPDGMTFKNWEIKKGLSADAVNINGDTITFTMPANDVTISAIYDKVPTPDPDPETKTHELKVFNAQIFLKDGSDVADLEAVPVDTELKAIAYEDTETGVFKYWTGLELTEEQSTARVVYFTMPDHDVNLMAVFVTPTNKLEVTDAKVTLKDGSAVADLTAVPVGTELKATALEKDGYTFTGWTATGIPADANFDGATVTFTMPANKVTLNAKYIANAPKTYELKVTNAQVTLKDGGAVADLTAVPVGTELVVTAPEKDGYTFTGWEVTGLPADVDTTKATISFKMPANNVTLKPQYKKNSYTLTVDGVDEPRVFDENVTVTAPEKDGYTFTGWEVTGLSADVDTTKATISFKMPANNVTLKAQYTENAPEKYTLTVNGKPEQRTVGEEVTLIARKPEGMTFSYWEIKKGLAADAVDVRSEKITFTMPANDVTISAIYVKDPTPDPNPEIKTHELKVSNAQIFLKDGSAVADLEAVPVDTELKAIAYADTETEVFKCWTGLELTEEQSTARVVYFTMPDHDVNLMAVFVTPTNKLDVSDATITLKDGSDVADLTAVPAGTELKATADEDTETRVFKNWNCTGLELTEEQRTARVVEFTMPDHDVELTAVFEVPATPDPDPTPAPSDDGGGAVIVAVAAVGGAAIGVGAYIAGTTAYLKSVLPEGMAIPANRQQLAVALWTAAGKPATQSTALFNDVAADAAELQAIRWVVETGLMTAQDGNFKPGSRVGRMEVIRTWKAYQQRG